MTWGINRITGVFGFAFSLFYTILSSQIVIPPGLTQGYLSSRTFPLAMGILMAISSIVIFFVKEGKEEENSEEIGLTGLKRVAPYIIITILFILSLQLLGMYFSIAIFMFLIMNLVARRTWLKDLITVVSITIAIWILFSLVLHVPLPTGIFKFI